jgi:dolichol-phosphate mannosyltransferase
MDQGTRFGSSRPKYSIRSRSRLAINIILSHSQKPLQISTGVGFATSFLAGCYGMYAVIQSLLFNSAVSGWTSLITVCCFFFPFIDQ